MNRRNLSIETMQRITRESLSDFVDCMIGLVPNLASNELALEQFKLEQYVKARLPLTPDETMILAQYDLPIDWE